MASLYTHQDSNVRKTWLLLTVFFIGVIAIGWGISWYLNSPAILYMAVIFALLMNVWSYWFSDKLVIKMTGAKPLPDEGSYQDVHNIVENLSITAGLPKPKLYIIEDPAPNAFATGRDPKHAAVAVTTGLLSIMDRHELEGVLAHELSHVGNRDMLVSTVAVVLAGVIAIISDMFLRMAMFGGGDRDRNIHPVMAIAIVVAALLAPLAASLVQLAISRKREYLADASGALLTRYPEGLASALQKIGSYSAPMKRANHATAHLFLSNPFGQGKRARGFFNTLFMTHPPLESRIKALLEHH
jgi:heat shock protein HtpX